MAALAGRLAGCGTWLRWLRWLRWAGAMAGSLRLR